MLDCVLPIRPMLTSGIVKGAGVRNHAAKNIMKSMKLGEKVRGLTVTMAENRLSEIDMAKTEALSCHCLLITRG